MEDLINEILSLELDLIHAQANTDEVLNEMGITPLYKLQVI